jgi:subtilisin family serine protease
MHSNTMSISKDWSKHWVFFRDKNVDARSLAGALDRLAADSDPRMLERRQRRRTEPGLVDERDLPTSARYREVVECAGARVVNESRWLNAVSVRADEETLASLRSLSCVTRIEPVRAGRRLSSLERPERIGGPRGYEARDFYGRSSDQLIQINLPALHAQGYTGQGVIIGILDTGFARTHIAFSFPGHGVAVTAEHDFVAGDADTAPAVTDDPDQHSHGTLILGCIGAYLPNELVGGAYNASFVLCKTEDVTSETPIEEDNYVAGLEFIEMHGGDVATSSLGYLDWYTQDDLDGATAVTTIAVNVATANGLHCCTAAGNEYHDADPATSHLIAPADALRVITCGAARPDNTIADFSSDGPTHDGRVKPELLALGSRTNTVWPFDDTSYAQASGTSLSTPLVCSAIACLTQAHPNWSVEKMRNYVMLRASDYASNQQTDPLFIRGYGLVDAAAASTDCPADVTGDLGVGIEDLLEYLGRYDAGSLAADTDDGSGTGQLDGGVGIEDLLYYLVRYDQGC